MANKKTLTIKDAFDELEDITNEFENGQLDLEASIPKFKRGLELAKYLKGRLSEVENEIIEIKAKYDQIDSENATESDGYEEDEDGDNDFDSTNHIANSDETNTLF